MGFEKTGDGHNYREMMDIITGRAPTFEVTIVFGFFWFVSPHPSLGASGHPVYWMST